MQDPPILFVKPKAISRPDKAALKEAGVLVIEVENPADVKLTRAHAEISAGSMLAAALKAIQASEYAVKAFAKLIIDQALEETNMKITNTRQ